MGAKTKAYIATGTVQAYVIRSEPWFMHHFGRSEYDRSKPILSDSLHRQAKRVVDQMNRGKLTDKQAKAELDKIYW